MPDDVRRKREERSIAEDVPVVKRKGAGEFELPSRYRRAKAWSGIRAQGEAKVGFSHNYEKMKIFIIYRQLRLFAFGTVSAKHVLP
jgi:hypothetical protein